MKRFSIVQTGYDINEVNRFIDIVVNRLEKISNENTMLTREIERLKEENSVNKLDEQKLSKAIIAIEETSDKMKRLAKEEASMIIDEAKRNANSIVHEALVTAQRTENEVNLLKKNLFAPHSYVNGVDCLSTRYPFLFTYTITF